ncbi:MAG: 50S ribosomal protein L10 [Chlamydiae bacterium]|nr:50S ribosomal protein L10 [Chlamydiota bacterium]
MLQEKELLLNEVKESITTETGFVILGYQKMAPNHVASFRQNLYENGSRLMVTKKRLFCKAAKDLGCDYNVDELPGHIAIVSCQDDFIQAAKSLCKFQKENDQNVKVLGGYFQNKRCTSEQVKIIAELPNLDEMRAQLLAVFEAPMAQTLAVFDAVLTSVPYCLQNKIEKETK